jgi:hypothetical protein
MKTIEIIIIVLGMVIVVILVLERVLVGLISCMLVIYV